MRILIGIAIFVLSSCAGRAGREMDKKKMAFTESEILEQLDLAYKGVPNQYYPVGNPGDIKYNFFLDLEEGYCIIAGSKIHLYADSTRWAVVFERSGYETRGTRADIQLDYVGNCIDYPIEKYPERSYITNSSRIVFIENTEFDRIENKEGDDMGTFEVIGPNIKEIKVRDNFIPFENNYKNYEGLGIKIGDDHNPRRLIGFGDLVRYLHETAPNLISASEDDIRKHIPGNVPKLMTIDRFHYISQYASDTLPSQQETYQLIGKVLTTKDSTNWRPMQAPNNSWKNWESGNL